MQLIQNEEICEEERKHLIECFQGETYQENKIAEG